MTDFILQVMLSNLLVAFVLAIFALVLQQRYHANALANIVWVVILIKLLTPPLVSVPLLEVGSFAESAPAVLGRPVMGEEALSVSAVTSSSDESDAYQKMGGHLLGDQSLAENGKSGRLNWALVMGVVWGSVSTLLLVVSLCRIVRFHIQVHRQSQPVELWVQQSGHQIATTIGLRGMPQISALSANISPFVWWLGGRPHIFVSQAAIDQLQPSQLRMVLAHEMMHIKRLDHFVRWLEWLAAATLWWNPVMWVARKQLRATEEIACDAMVIQMTGVARYDYASSLLNMAEILTQSAIRPPTVASQFNSGGVLEKRLNMIISNEQFKITQWMRMLTIALAVCIFPVGLVYAQDYGAVQRRLVEAVKAGELSREQVAPMMEALKKNAKPVVVQGEDAAKRERYKAGAKKIEEAIKSGRVSKADGEKRLTEMLRKQMFPVRGNKDAKSDRGEATDRGALRRRYAEGARRIEAAIKSGEVSQEDGEKRLIEMRNRMSPDGGDKAAKSDKGTKSDRANAGDMEAKKRRYMAGAEEIEAAVKAGKLSKEDAEKKLIEMRTKIFRSGGDKGVKSDKGAKSDRANAGDMEAKKRRYMAGAEEVEAAVKAGKLSKEDAEKNLIEMRTKIFRSGGDKAAKSDKGAKSDRANAGDMEAKKRRYMAVAKKIEAAVEAGRLSPEDAKKKMNEMREKMFGK